MAKNRIKKRAAAAAANMSIDDISTFNQPVQDTPQAMDTSENVASNSSVDGLLRKMKKGRPMKRSKNMRKMKAVAKAISKTEKLDERSCKMDSKIARTKLSKNLYD